MSQYTINIGALPNDGTGDPLRTAFNETNLNFDQVFAAGPVLSNIQIANNSILTTNTNGNLVLVPNGIGIVQANASIVPNMANIRNLGSSTQRWATVYTQYLNVSAGTSVNGNLTVDGNLIVMGNVINMGNIVTDTLTIQLANTANSANSANGAGITVGLNDNIATMLYNSASNVWAMNIGLDTPNLVVNNISSDDSTFVTVQDGLDVQGDLTADTIGATGNITGAYFIGNGSQLTGITSYANANVVAYANAGWAGNIIPATSNTYSLGNATNQWNDLYVSNATIYMNNVPISLTAGNVLTVNGTDVVTTSNGVSNIGNLLIQGTSISIVPGAPNTGIDISPNGESWAYLQLPHDATANASDTRLHNDAGNIEFGTGQFSTSGPGYTWTLNNDGTMTFPGTPRIDTDANNFEVQAAEAINFEANTVVNIYTDTSGTTKQWQFGDSGDLSVPGDVQFADGSFITDNLEATGDFGISTAANVGFMIDTNEAAHTWTFNTTGNLNLPTNGSINFDAGGIVQAVDEDFAIRVQDADDDGFAVLQQVDDGSSTVLGLTQLRRDQFLVEFAGGAAPQFRFSENGEMQLPGNVRWDNYADQSLYAVADNNSAGTVELKTISYAGDTLGSNVRVTQSNATISTSNALYTWLFDNTGNLTLPAGGFLDVGGGIVARTGASPAPYLSGFSSLSTAGASGNISASGNLVATANVLGNNATFTTAVTARNLNADGGNISLNPDFGLIFTQSNAVITANTQSWTFDEIGNLTIPNSILGTNSGNPIVIDAGGATGGYSYVSVPSFTDGGEQLVIKNDYSSSLGIRFETETGNFSLLGNNLSFTDSTTQNTAYPGSASALTLSGNISGGNILGNGASMTGVATKTTGTWTVISGTNTYSFTVPANGVYQLWVEGNIANGIIAYNATVSVTNTNVPVIGQQFAWNYEGPGTPLLFTSIPAQIIGTAGAISNAAPSVGTTTNTFDFGINNSSGGNVTVNYGYTKIS